MRRAERGTWARSDTRTHIRANVRERTRSREDVRVRADVNTNVRARARGDRQHVWNDNTRTDSWRYRDNWRYRDGGTRVRVGIGYSEPYYSYGAFDDGYYAYGNPEPTYRGYSDSRGSYAASPGCTCSPAPYAAYDTSYKWGSGSGIGFTAW